VNVYEWVETLLFFVAFIALIKPFGTFMARVYQGERTVLSPVILPCENLLYRICGVDRDEQMDWKRYAIGLLLFNLMCGVTLFAILLLQGILPLNPQKFPAFSWHLAFNTAISFTTNTNWQNYSGESAASYFTQMFGFAVHNFASAATGMAVAMALIRGFVRKKTKAIGNFWVDLTRSIQLKLLPNLDALVCQEEGLALLSYDSTAMA
jgi:K+-transporting ATPase ATPase A chain